MLTNDDDWGWMFAKCVNVGVVDYAVIDGGADEDDDDADDLGADDCHGDGLRGRCLRLLPLPTNMSSVCIVFNFVIVTIWRHRQLWRGQAHVHDTQQALRKCSYPGIGKVFFFQQHCTRELFCNFKHIKSV